MVSMVWVVGSDIGVVVDIGVRTRDGVVFMT